MKRILGLVIAATSAFSAHADCVLHSTRQPSVTKLLNQHGGWEFANYERVCEKLKRANASVNIVSDSVVLGNQSIGWASVMVKDKNSSVMTSSYSSMSTYTNGYASQDKADEMMWIAVNDALNNWRDLDKALASLDQERQNLKKR